MALLQAVWSSRCSALKCYNDVKTIAFFHGLEMYSYQLGHPDLGTGEVLGIVGKKFIPVYQDLIDNSKARAAAEAAWEANRAAKVKASIQGVSNPVFKPLTIPGQ